MTLTIRPVGDDDLDAYVAVRNATEPDHPVTVDELRDRDARRLPKLRCQRYLADADGTVAAVGGYSQHEFSYHPGHFHISGNVLDSWKGKGIGTALFERVCADLEAFSPTRLAASTRDDRDDALAFLTGLGFVETLREWESRLDVATFDPAPFGDAEDKARAAGVTFTTLADEFAALGRDAALRKLYVLDAEAGKDVPADTPFSQPPYEEWVTLFGGRGFRAESFFLAIAPDGEYAGISMLFHREASPELSTGLTGVRRDWRRKGIALALKLRAIAYARSIGAPAIRTENAAQNVGMLAINQALGFQRLPAFVSFKKQLAPE